MQPDLTRDQYIETLRRMYTDVQGWETWAALHAPEPYEGILVARLLLRQISALSAQRQRATPLTTYTSG